MTAITITRNAKAIGQIHVRVATDADAVARDACITQARVHSGQFVRASADGHVIAGARVVGNSIRTHGRIV